MDGVRLGEGRREEKRGTEERKKKLKRIGTERRRSDPGTSLCRCYAFGSREQRDDEDQALTLKGH